VSLGGPAHPCPPSPGLALLISKTTRDRQVRHVRPIRFEGVFPAPGSGTPRFSVFDLAVTGGEVDFVDGPRQRTHTICGLQLGLPFLSNIGARREVFTQAHLASTLNGEAFRLDASTRPFAADRRSELTLDIPRIALQAYTAYWPAGLPLQPRAGELSLKATVAFEQRGTPQVAVSGTLGLRDLALARGSQPMLAVQAFELRVDRATWPSRTPFGFDGSAQVEALPLSAVSGWLADWVRPPVAGALSGDAQVTWPSRRDAPSWMPPRASSCRRWPRPWPTAPACA